MAKDMDFKQIAVLDDDRLAMEQLSLLLYRAGIEPILPPHDFHQVADAFEWVKSSAEGIVCDHLLAEGQAAEFTGAELASVLYDARLPAVVISTFIHIDPGLALRRYRYNLPSVLARSDAQLEAIAEGLQRCQAEIQESRPKERAAHQTITRVARFDRETKAVSVVLPHWSDPDDALDIPLELFPTESQGNLVAGQYFKCQVNLDEEAVEKLFVIKLEPVDVPEDADVFG